MLTNIGDFNHSLNAQRENSYIKFMKECLKVTCTFLLAKV